MTGERQRHRVRSGVVTFTAATILATLLVAVRLAIGPAAPAAAAMIEGPPGAPTAVAAVAGNHQIDVSWEPPADDGGSQVIGYTVTANPGGAVSTTAGATTTTVTGLVNGTSYTIIVTATNAFGTGPASDASASVTPMTVPSAPANVMATRGDGQAAVAWQVPADDGGGAITGYTVTAAPGGASATTTQATSATVVGLSNGVNYTFTVTASNAAGESPASVASQSITPAGVPGAPIAVAASAGDGRATVTWSPPANDGGTLVTAYTVTSWPGGATVQTAGATTATVAGLNNGTSYTFTVTAANAVGTGPASAPSSAATPATAPSAPQAITATAGDASATLTWSAPSSNGGAAITSYTVTASPGGMTAVVSGTTATVTGLTNGTSYTFVVTATNWAGTGPASSPSAALIPARLPAAPTGAGAMAGNGQAVVTWTAPAYDALAPVTGYTVTAMPGGATSVVTAPATSLAVFGLTNGVSYTFTVTATNRIGISAASSPSAAITPHVPNSSACVNATIVWSGAAQDGLWATAANWNPSRVPSSSDRVCLPEASTPTIAGSASAGGIDVQAGASLEIRTAAAGTLQIYGTITNNGTIRITGAGGFTLNCGSAVVNNAIVQIGTTGGTTGAAVFAGYSGCTQTMRPTFRNTANGLLETKSTAQVSFDGYVTTENDGVVNARAGTLIWRSYYGGQVEDGVSTGRFAGEGGVLRLGGANIGPATQWGNGVVVDGSLTGSGSLPAGVTLTLVTSGSLYAQLTGPGWVSAQGGTILGDIVGNVRIEPSTAPVSIGSSSTSAVTVQSTGLMEIVTAKPTVNGTLNNLGTIRIPGVHGLYVGCGSTVTNSGLIQITATGGTTGAATFTGSNSCYGGPYPKLRNAANGVLETLSTATVSFDGYVALENDGVVTARAGTLSWRGSYGVIVEDGVSTGRFAGEGGTLRLSMVTVGPATQLTNGLILDGYLFGSANLPAGVTLTMVTSGSLYAQLSGPGWVSAQGGSILGDIVGNVRVETSASVSIGSGTTSTVTIQPTGLVEIANNALTVNGTVNNFGSVRVLGQNGFYQSCLATFVNHGLLQLATTAGSATVATFRAEDWNCGLNNRAKVLNASDGTIESLATTRVTFDGYAALTNNGIVVARAGRMWWRSYSSVVPSAGSFAGEGGVVELAAVAVSPETQLGNGLEVNGSLTGSGSLPAGVTLTLVTSGTLAAQLSGPGWVSAKGGTLIGDIVGNIRVEPVNVPVSAGTSTSSVVTIRPGGVVETVTARLNVNGTLTNNGTLRVAGPYGLYQACLSTVANNGLIQVANTGGSGSVSTFTGELDWWCNSAQRPKFLNNAGAVLESLAASRVSFDGWMNLDNDGLVVSRAGNLVWRSYSGALIPDGRFSGEGGTVELSGVQVGPLTQFGNGIVINGSVTGTGTIPDGITVTMESGGYLYAQLSGPGWILAHGGWLMGEIAGNLRISPPAGGYVFAGQSLSSTVTVQASGTLEIATQSTQTIVYGTLINRGMLRVTGASAFTMQCQTTFTNYGVVQLAATLGSTVDNTFDGGRYCFDQTPKPRLINAVGGTFESYAVTTPKISQYLPWENHGQLIAKGGNWLLFPGDATVVHDGYFGSSGSGHLVLCGLFFINDGAAMADNVGLSNGCGTMVANVTDFTPPQIQDIKDARSAALTLVSLHPPVSEEYPACYFRGVNLVELFGEYPDMCVYDPGPADTIEFFIEWMPGLGAALDIGHAIFGMDLAGRELSPTERILDGLFAVFPGNVDQLILKGTERLRYRALLRGAGDVCNSFSGSTPVLLADGTTKPISQIHRSELVMAEDPITGVAGPRPVVNVIQGIGEKQLVDITVSSGDHLTATSNHPFWLEDAHDFVEAGSLPVGGLLRTSAGTYVQITAVAQRTEWARVYNLTVANLHTFYVGDAHVLVHNTNPVCGSAARRLLRAALGASPYTNGQAHHLFGVADFNTDLGHKLSHDFEIDLNGVDNGLWLPSGPYTGLTAAFKGSFHSGMSAGYYTSFVNSYLEEAVSRADALNRLGDIKSWLLNGCMPINRTGVRVKPAHGTCPSILVDHYHAFGIDIELP
jgi:fibronectin type 3 domain-containing protein